MKRLKLIYMMLICGLLCTACQSIENTQLPEDSTENTSSIDTSLENIDTSIIMDTSSTTELTTIETSSTEETSETSSTDTSTEDTTTDTSNLETSTDETISNIDTSNSYNDLVIPINSNSEYITESMCKEISEYFNSMTQVDVDTFKSKQLSAYNTYMEEYLLENESDFESMLNIYNDNYLVSSGSEKGVYSEYTLNSISLNYSNDVDSILNTMNYIDQLDEITQQYEDYIISSELTAYYQLNYTIDYTLKGNEVEDFNGTKIGSILVLDINGEISLIMLY